MKYDNFFTLPQRISLAVFISCLFFGCAGSEQKPTKTAKVEAQGIVPTKVYLPTRSYDKEGNLLPFTPMANPYTAIGSKIDKEVVLNFIEARKAIKLKNYGKAKPLLEQAAKSDKTLAGPWVLLGEIAVQENQLKKAEEYFNKAIGINPQNVNAYLPLALIQRKKGEFVEAQNTYSRALSVWKDFPEAHLNLAILYDLYLNDSLQAQQHMEAFQFLSNNKDEQVNKWLEEIRSRTGIEANLYIGPSNASQIQQTAGDKS